MVGEYWQIGSRGADFAVVLRRHQSCGRRAVSEIVHDPRREQLPERDRAVIHMRFFDRMGQDDIAKRIGVSQSYLSRMLRRILLDLRSQLANDGEPPIDFED